jgi:hypothetical protein
MSRNPKPCQDRSSVPRFYLHVYDGHVGIEDNEGMDLPDLECARARVVSLARELMQRPKHEATLDQAGFVEIEDARGRLVAVVFFADIGLSQFGPTPEQDQRLSTRTVLCSPAHVCTFDGCHAAIILNVSPDGAKVQTTAPLKTNAQLVLSYDALERPAVVKWRRGSCYGLRFTTGPDAGQISNQLR